MLLDAVAGILLQTHCVFSIRSDQSRMGVRGTSPEIKVTSNRVRVYVCACVCVCVCVYVCMCAYVSMLGCMRMYMRVREYCVRMRVCVYV